MTRNEVQEVLTRVSNLTSGQIADRIVATDLAVLVDNIGYASRRAPSVDKWAASMRHAMSTPAGGVLHA